jgi:hypothetical protein
MVPVLRQTPLHDAISGSVGLSRGLAQQSLGWR